MREIFILVAHPLGTLAKFMRSGGVRAVVAESLLLKHQLLTLKRSRNRAPKLTPWDQLFLAFGSVCVSSALVPKTAAAFVLRVTSIDPQRCAFCSKGHLASRTPCPACAIARATERLMNTCVDFHCLLTPIFTSSRPIYVFLLSRATTQLDSANAGQISTQIRVGCTWKSTPYVP